MTGNIFDAREIRNDLERSSHDIMLGYIDCTKICAPLKKRRSNYGI